MDTVSAFGFEDLVGHAVAEMAMAVSARQGEGEGQQRARFQAAVHMIMGLQPRDVIEVMLAGHCVMLHAVMTADVHDSLSGKAGGSRRGAVTLNKAFSDNLDRLERYRRRPAEGEREAPEATSVQRPPPPTERAATPAVPELNRAARRQAARAEMRAAAAASRAALRPVGRASPGQTPPGTPPHALSPEATSRSATEQPPGGAFDPPTEGGW